MLKLPENIDLSEYAKKSDVDAIDASLDNKADKKEVEKISSQLDNSNAEVAAARNGFETLGKRLDGVDSQLDTIEKHINSVEINVLFPPVGIEPLIPNDESLETATINTQRLNNILNYYSSNLVTL